MDSGETGTPRTLLSRAMEAKTLEKTTRLTRAISRLSQQARDGNTRHSPRYSARRPSGDSVVVNRTVAATRGERLKAIDTATDEFTPRTLLSNYLSGHDTIQQSIRKKHRVEQTPATQRKAPRLSKSASSNAEKSLRKKATVQHFLQSSAHVDRQTPRGLIEGFLQTAQEETPVPPEATHRRKSMAVPSPAENPSEASFGTEESFIVPPSLPGGSPQIYKGRFTQSLVRDFGSRRPPTSLPKLGAEVELEEQREDYTSADMERKVQEEPVPTTAGEEKETSGEVRSEELLGSSRLQSSASTSALLSASQPHPVASVSIRESTRLVPGELHHSAEFGEESAIVVAPNDVPAHEGNRDRHQAVYDKDVIVAAVPDSMQPGEARNLVSEFSGPRVMLETNAEALGPVAIGMGEMSTSRTASPALLLAAATYSVEHGNGDGEDGETAESEYVPIAMEEERQDLLAGQDNAVGFEGLDDVGGRNYEERVDTSYSRDADEHLVGLGTRSISPELSTPYAKTPVLPPGKAFATPRTPMLVVQQSNAACLPEKAIPKGKHKLKVKRVGPPRLPTSLTRSIFTHFAGCKVDRAAIQEVEKVADKYWKNLASDLGAYARHASRKTVEESDVELLMKRQGFVTEGQSLYTLVEKYLPLEYRQEVIPMARSGNRVVPKR